MQIVRTQNPAIDQALAAYVEAKHAADSANRQLEDAEAKLLNLMKHNQVKTTTLDMGGVKFSATYTQRTTNQINEQGLRKALSARVYDRYTVKKLDRRALEQAMTDGDVDPMIVAKFVEQVPGKTYLTYRAKEEADEQQAAGL